MSVIAFEIIVVLVGVLCVVCGLGFALKPENNNPTLGTFLFLIGTIVIIFGLRVVVISPCNNVEIDRMLIAVESIDAYDINDYQQYKITTEDGVVYDTAITSFGMELWDENINFASVEESEDNEFHLYNITYQEQKKIGSLTLTGRESTKLVLEVPHEYYLLHTKEQDNNMTRVYTSNE